MNIGGLEQQDFDKITNRLFNKINKLHLMQNFKLRKIDYKNYIKI